MNYAQSEDVDNVEQFVDVSHHQFYFRPKVKKSIVFITRIRNAALREIQCRHIRNVSQNQYRV